MPNELRFALYALKKNIQSSAELRTSFLINVIGMMINNTAFILLWIFFVQSVGTIGGWTGADVVALNGFTSFCYGVVFSAAGGIRRLPEYAASGVFDRFMLSPKNLLLRISTAHFAVSAVGDILFGIICFFIYGILVHTSVLQVGMIVALVVFTSIIFFAMTILIFSSSFFFIESSQVTNGLFEIFFTPALFHGGAFQGAMRFIFTFFIPSLLVGGIPVEAVRHVSLGTVGLIGVASICWFLISVYVFHKALRKYESANFMTFGS